MICNDVSWSKERKPVNTFPSVFSRLYSSSARTPFRWRQVWARDWTVRCWKSNRGGFYAHQLPDQRCTPAALNSDEKDVSLFRYYHVSALKCNGLWVKTSFNVFFLLGFNELDHMSEWVSFRGAVRWIFLPLHKDWKQRWPVSLTLSKVFLINCKL